MADPAPLTDDEIQSLKDWWTGKLREWPRTLSPIEQRLVATVEQTCRERDAAYAVICQLTDDWDPEEQADPCAHAWTPDEVDAIRRARAVPGAEEDQ